MNKTFLAGGFAALLVASGVALAVTNDKPAPAGPDAERVMSVADMQQRSAERFKRLDTNNDGSISWAEAEAGRGKWRGERSDDHGDRGHRGHGGGHRMGFGGGPGGRLAQLDTDGNGAVSLAEYNAGMNARLARLDANHDGKVTRDEFRAAREAFRGEREDGK
jgi:hypothetical protein